MVRYLKKMLGSIVINVVFYPLVILWWRKENGLLVLLFFYRYIYWVILRLVDSLLANPHYGSSSILYLAACSITRKGESFGQLGP